MLLKSLILTGAVQGLFLILLLRTKKKNSNSDHLLMIWLGIIATQLLFYYDNLSDKPLITNLFQYIGFSLPLISAPVLYLYIYALSFDYKYEWKKLLLHSVPFLLFNGITCYFYFLSPEETTIRNGIPNFSIQVPQAVIYLLINLMAIVPGFYAVLSLITLQKHKNQLPDNYSYTEKINLNWLRSIVISLLVLFSSLFFLIRYGPGYGLIKNENLFSVVGSILSFYIFFIGYFGLRQTTVFVNVNVPVTPERSNSKTSAYKNSGLNEAMVDQLFQKLLNHMDEQKPFLDENLSLNILAAQLDLNPNQLSQVINQKSEVNFFNFINSYRVEAVKEKLKDPTYSHYSLLAIGYECGFQSKSSFNKIFKHMTDQTPSQYQKSQL